MPRKYLLLLVLAGTTPALAIASDPSWITRSPRGMVASDSPEASRIGADVLEQGGNAFDAAIATSLALAVARPHSTGLGGGGFMVAYIAAEKRFVALDFREMAPAGATPERYAQLRAEQGSGPPPTVCGGNAIAVPGQLAGLYEIHRRYASWSMQRLARPAIDLASHGFVVDAHYRSACQETLAQYEKWPELRDSCSSLYESLLGSGQPPELGARVKRPRLASALRLIVRQGPDIFYRGWIGESIVRAANAAGGKLSMKDLAAYRVRERQPIRTEFRPLSGEPAYEIISMPPPSSGGICMAESLNILQAVRVRSDLHPEQDRYHVLIEAMKHAFADRARWLGDPDSATIPAARLTSVAYAVELARRIQPGKTLEPDAYGLASPPDDHGTSHFCIADQAGNVVAMTETINTSFGSLVVADPYGIILNNEMDDFTADPGRPNLFGLVQGEANAIAPGKRPLSSMSPTLVFSEGKPVLAVGASGGPLIITSALQVMLNVLKGNMPLEDAVQALRVHHQWLPNEVYFDRDPPADLVTRLEACGHQLAERHKTGIVQAIRFLPDGTMVGASDPHKGGQPAGVE
jgi:gamma-glutamyltranspeptidase/glutathione hydrolase